MSSDFKTSDFKTSDFKTSDYITIPVNTIKFISNYQGVRETVPLTKLDVSNIKESTSTILETSLVLQFLTQLNQFKDICNNMYNISVLEFIEFNIETFEINYLNTTIQIVNGCLESSKLIILPISVMHKSTLGSEMAHLNVLIIDTVRNTIEYFEPMGFNMSDSYNLNPYYVVTSSIKKIFPLLQTFRTYNVSNMPMSRGLQYLEDPNSTLCGAWGLYIITLRILNNNLSIKSSESIAQFLNRYIIETYTDSSNKPFLFTESTGSYLIHPMLSILIKRFISFIETNLKPVPYEFKITRNTINDYLELNPFNEISLQNRIKFLTKSFFENLKNNTPNEKHFHELISLKSLPNYFKIINNEFNDFQNKMFLNQSISRTQSMQSLQSLSNSATSMEIENQMELN